MVRLQDITGCRFGRLIVIARAVSKNDQIQWLCRCDCGTEKLILGRNLRDGITQSCGCLMREIVSHLKRTHGQARPRTVEYRTWQSIRERCYNPDSPRFSCYGARGIVVCERWRNSFAAFFADMGPRPPGRYSIERIDNDGHYEPTNCRWLPMSEQYKNKRPQPRSAWPQRRLKYGASGRR